MLVGRFMFSWTILYQLKRGYLYNALQRKKTIYNTPESHHGYFKSTYPTIQLQTNSFFRFPPNKKLTANKDVETQKPTRL